MLVLFLAAGGLAACSSASTIDMIPTAAGGLPGNAPARPAVPPEYPTVNEMPQRREALPLTDDELNRVKSELTTLRTQQEERTGTVPKSAKAPAKKDTADPKAAKKPNPKDLKQPTELTSAKDQPK